MEPKRLYRVEAGRILAGVCGGVADYFGIDRNLARLLWVVLSVFTAVFPCLLIYCVAAFLLPRESEV